MVCRSFSISARWPNVVNIRGWFLPDHRYFITDDKPCSGKCGGGTQEGWALFKWWAQPSQEPETDCHAFASASTPFSLSLSAFCFSCQENWQAVGMKKSGSSWESLQLRGHAQAQQKKKNVKVLSLDTSEGGEQKEKKKVEELFLEALKLLTFYKTFRQEGFAL